jgi:hypothetical protein
MNDSHIVMLREMQTKITKIFHDAVERLEAEDLRKAKEDNGRRVELSEEAKKAMEEEAGGG